MCSRSMSQYIYGCDQACSDSFLCLYNIVLVHFHVFVNVKVASRFVEVGRRGAELQAFLHLSESFLQIISFTTVVLGIRRVSQFVDHVFIILRLSPCSEAVHRRSVGVCKAHLAVFLKVGRETPREVCSQAVSHCLYLLRLVLG